MANLNTGGLWNNPHPSENAPAYTGVININGVEYKIAAWARTAEHTHNPKAPILTIKVQPVGFQRVEPHKYTQADAIAKAPKLEDIDDDIPF